MLLLSIHVRHGCYLMQGHYTCLGTKETLSEMLGMMDKSPSTRMKEHDERNRRKATGPGHPAPARTSGPSRKPGHPAPARKSGAHHRRHPKLNQVSPDIRPPGPDIRPVARTSGPLCLCAAHLGRGPCTPSSLRLYILPHLLLVRVRIGSSHLR